MGNMNLKLFLAGILTGLIGLYLLNPTDYEAEYVISHDIAGEDYEFAQKMKEETVKELESGAATVNRQSEAAKSTTAVKAKKVHTKKQVFVTEFSAPEPKRKAKKKPQFKAEKVDSAADTEIDISKPVVKTKKPRPRIPSVNSKLRKRLKKLPSKIAKRVSEQLRTIDGEEYEARRTIYDLIIAKAGRLEPGDPELDELAELAIELAKFEVSLPEKVMIETRDMSKSRIQRLANGASYVLLKNRLYAFTYEMKNLSLITLSMVNTQDSLSALNKIADDLQIHADPMAESAAKIAADADQG